eukprot:Skav218077  [mRNA]  locus=scaffold1832:171751:178187:- [translate_table: standard]
MLTGTISSIAAKASSGHTRDPPIWSPGTARPSVDAGDGSAAGGDDPRKVKRLQQEIQRLSQRLAESEMYSAHDDGLPKFSLEEVEVGSMIAQGGFASVHYATWQCTPCALKKIFDPVLTEELKGEFENEVRMLRKLRHPNVVTLMAVCRMPPALSPWPNSATLDSLACVQQDKRPAMTVVVKDLEGIARERPEPPVLLMTWWRKPVWLSLQTSDPSLP